METTTEKEKNNITEVVEEPVEIPQGPGHLLRQMLKEKKVKAMDLIAFIERDFQYSIELNRIYKIYEDSVTVHNEEINMIIVSGGLDGGEFNRRLVPYTKKSATEGRYSKIVGNKTGTQKKK